MSRRVVTCACTTCRTPIERGQLMCKRHWMGLPDRLRHGIMTTFRARHTANYQQLVSEAIDLADAMPGPLESRRAASVRTASAIDARGQTVRWTEGRLL